nr:SMC-Scp complex subunit ScpB [Acidobacteriota bacterium]
MSERSDMEAALEAVLFVSSEPVPRGRLLEMFEVEEREQAMAALEAVLARYQPAGERGIMAEEVAGGVRLATRPEMVGWLRRFFDVPGGNKLSMAALETLAIVAYRQPITAPEIQELRSVNSAGVLKNLLEKRLVRIAGRKEVVGKPFLYATTREFLVHFGLNSLRDLPPLEEFEETFGSGAGAAGGDAGFGGASGTSWGEAGEPLLSIVPAAEAARALETRETLESAASSAAEDREERILREAAELEEARGAAEE